MSETTTEPRAVPPRPATAARVLHTSDWHLGVSVRNEPRSADHEAVIAEILRIARAAEPDLILHTGDLFDGPRPPMVEFGRAIRALRDLAEVAPVVVLAGNHDSATALEVLGIALGDDVAAEVEAGTYDPHAPGRHRIRIHHRPTLAEKGAVTAYPTAAGFDLRLVALPFVHANRLLTDFAALTDPNATYNDAIRTIIELLAGEAKRGFDPGTDVAVFASHLHVSGATTSSERAIHVSEQYATEPAHLDPIFGYLAFGHVHVPQAVASGRGTYAGSILEVDFGEEGEQKRVVLADLAPGRPTSITSVPLTAGRRLHRIATPLSQLAEHAAAVGDGIVEVTVRAEPDAAAGTLDTILIGDEAFDTLSAAVASVLVGATVVGVIDGRNPHAGAAVDLDDGASAPESVEAAFRAWLGDTGAPVFASAGGGVAVADRVATLFDDLHAGVAAGERSPLAEPDALRGLAVRAGLLESRPEPDALPGTGPATGSGVAGESGTAGESGPASRPEATEAQTTLFGGPAGPAASAAADEPGAC